MLRPKFITFDCYGALSRPLFNDMARAARCITCAWRWPPDTTERGLHGRNGTVAA